MAGKTRAVRPFYDRFWEKVKTGHGCWEWQGATTGPGAHGRTVMDGQMIMAHRASWIMHNGPIPDGRLVLHLCDNPPCVRPTHLYLGDFKDNARDAVTRGRMHWPSADKTECINGHPYTPENTYRSPKTGRRQCNICRSWAERRRRRRAA